MIHWQVTPTEGKGKQAGLDGAATRPPFRPDNFVASPMVSLLAESHLAQSLALEKLLEDHNVSSKAEANNQ